MIIRLDKVLVISMVDSVIIDSKRYINLGFQVLLYALAIVSVVDQWLNRASIFWRLLAIKKFELKKVVFQNELDTIPPSGRWPKNNRYNPVLE